MSSIVKFLKERRKPIAILLVFLLIVTPIITYSSVLQKNKEKQLQTDSPNLGKSSEEPTTHQDGVLGASGDAVLGASEGGLHFALKQDIVDLGDDDFSLEENLEVTNGDGTPNDTVQVINDGGFDVDIEAAYKVTYLATDFESDEQRIKTYDISVREMLWEEDVRIKVDPMREDSFPTHYLWQEEQNPPLVPYRLTVSVNDPELAAKMYIEIDIGDLVGIEGVPYFLPERVDNLPEDSFFDNIEIDGTFFRLHFSEGVEKKGTEEIQVYFKFQENNLGKVIHYNPIGEAHYRVYLEDELQKEEDIQVLHTSVNDSRMYFKALFAIQPKIPLGSNRTFFIKSYEMKDLIVGLSFSYGDRHEVLINAKSKNSNLYMLYPEGTKITESFDQKVTDNVQVAEGEYPGIPAGNYAMVEMTLAHASSSTKEEWHYGINARVELPPLAEGETTRTDTVYTFVEWETIPEPGVKKRTPVTDFRYHITYGEQALWNVRTPSDHSSTTIGVLTQPNSVSIEGGRVGSTLDNYNLIANIGSLNVEDVMLKHTIKEPRDGSPRKFPNVDQYGIIAQNVNPSVYGTVDLVVEYYFVVRDTASDTSYQTQKKQISAHMPTIRNIPFWFDLPSLSPTEYIEEIIYYPMGSDGTAPNVLPPGTRISQVDFWGKSWTTHAWPDGTPYAERYTPVKLDFEIQYKNGHTGALNSLDLTGGEIIYLQHYPIDPQLNITTKDTYDRVQPGEILDYQMEISFDTDYAIEWTGATFVLELPYGSELLKTESTYVGHKYNSSERGLVEISKLPSVDGNNYYKLVTPDTFNIAKKNKYGGIIPLKIKVSENIPLGHYPLIAISTNEDPTTYYPDVERNLPPEYDARNFGIYEGGRYTYSVDTIGQNHFTVITNERMRSYSAIKSEYSNGWSYEPMVPAGFSENVEIKLNITSQETDGLGGITLYDIVPYPGYLETTEHAEVILDSVSTQEGTVYYYHGSSPPDLTTIQSINPKTDAGWNKVAKGATAFFIDFEDVVLTRGKSLEALITFKTPSTSTKEFKVNNMFSYTAGKFRGGQLEDHYYYTSRKQGYATDVYYIDYHKAPENAVIEQMPTIQVGAFTEASHSLWVSQAQPTREGYEFISWNTKADGTGTTYLGGEKVTFTPTGIKKLDLYPIWKSEKPIGKLTVNIIAEDVWTAHGPPYVTVRAWNLDTNDVFYQSVPLAGGATLTGELGTPAAEATGTAKFDGITTGYYYVTAIPDVRLKIKKGAINVYNVHVTGQDQSILFELENLTHTYLSGTTNGVYSFELT